MSLDAGAKSVNIKMSLDKYIQDNFQTTEGIDIDYEGLPFDSTASTEWIQARIVDIQSDFMRQASGTEYGEDTNILLSLNVFVDKSGVTMSHKHYYLRDKIFNYFKVKQNIALRSYADSGTTLLAYMQVREVVTDRVIGETNEYYQYATAFSLDFVRKTTEAT